MGEKALPIWSRLLAPRRRLRGLFALPERRGQQVAALAPESGDLHGDITGCSVCGSQQPFCPAAAHSGPLLAKLIAARSPLFHARPRTHRPRRPGPRRSAPPPLPPRCAPAPGRAALGTSRGNLGAEGSRPCRRQGPSRPSSPGLRWRLRRGPAGWAAPPAARGGRTGPAEPPPRAGPALSSGDRLQGTESPRRGEEWPLGPCYLRPPGEALPRRHHTPPFTQSRPPSAPAHRLGASPGVHSPQTHLHPPGDGSHRPKVTPK